MEQALLRAYQGLLDKAGFETTFLPRSEATPYDAISFQVPGGEEAGAAVVHINFLPLGERAGTSAIGQIIAQLPQTILPGREGAVLSVANQVNHRILMGHFMPGPHGALFWRHTFYLTYEIDPSHNVRLMDQMMGLLLHTLHAMWEPLGRTAQGEVDVREAVEMVLAKVPQA